MPAIGRSISLLLTPDGIVFTLELAVVTAQITFVLVELIVQIGVTTQYFRATGMAVSKGLLLLLTIVRLHLLLVLVLLLLTVVGLHLLLVFTLVGHLLLVLLLFVLVGHLGLMLMLLRLSLLLLMLLRGSVMGRCRVVCRSCVAALGTSIERLRNDQS